nr:hypothetical protein [Tanacetum cinerariifolium]
MTTVNQGMSVEEIERVVAQRVANAIEAIAIYETKTNLAHKSMSQTERQEEECKFHHNGPCTVKYGNYKKVGHIIQNFGTPATAKNQRTHTCYECGSLRHYKKLTLQGIRRRNITADLSRCVINSTITMMVHVLPNATSATDLATWPVTVGVLQISILLTSKKALEQVRRLHAVNVGTKGTTREIVRSKRTKTMKTKSKVLRHVEWCMPLEEEKPNKTLTTLRMRLKLKRESCLT